MPRVGRKAVGGVVYHVLNRGNGKSRLFHKPEDYDAFLRILSQVKEAVPVRVLGLCLMPNHWHLLLRPAKDGDLSRFMLRLATTHVRRSIAHRHDRGGHIYQGRFKSFPVQDDLHLLTVLRYVEANPLRTNLAKSPRGWAWSSYSLRLKPAGQNPALLDALPVPLPDDWEQIVQQRWEKDELDAVRNSVRRGSPFGSEKWVRATAKKLGLDFTLRPRGRPPKQPKPKARGDK